VDNQTPGKRKTTETLQLQSEPKEKRPDKRTGNDERQGLEKESFIEDNRNAV
jgi:hypothetical protein